MPESEQPDVVQVVMPREFFECMKRWIGWDYPGLMLYRMPDSAQEEGIETFGIAPNPAPSGETPMQRFQRLHPNRPTEESA